MVHNHGFFRCSHQLFDQMEGSIPLLISLNLSLAFA